MSPFYPGTSGDNVNIRKELNEDDRSYNTNRK